MDSFLLSFLPKVFQKSIAYFIWSWQSLFFDNCFLTFKTAIANTSSQLHADD